MTGKIDEWRSFGNFLGHIFAKYAQEVCLDDLPDPETFYAMRCVEEYYRLYMRCVYKNKNSKHFKGVEYVFY